MRHRAPSLLNGSGTNALANFATNKAAGNFTIQNGVSVTTASSDFDNAGTINLLPGTLNVGNYTQETSGTLGIGLGGQNAGQFGLLNATGTATLAGTFNVSSVSSYQPPPGSMYQVMNFLSKTGDFSKYNGLQIGPTLLTPTFLPQGNNPTNLTLNGQGVVAGVSVGTTLQNSTYGQSVSFTVLVTGGGPTPTGSVQFVVDGSNFGAAVALASGQATSQSVANLGAGPHTVVADYLGDSNYAAANSPTFTQTVNKAHLAVVPDDLSKTVGQANPPLTAHFTGFVLGETAVTANVTGTPTLATTATTASPVGSYPITVTSANTLSAANYDFPANLFGQGTLTVTQGATPTVSVATSQQNSTYGQSVSFTVLVTGGGPTPTGSVQFVVDGSNFGAAVALASGQATSQSAANLGAGPHTVVADYLGDSNYAAANSPTFTQTVNKAHLAVVPDDLSKTVGQANPPLTAHFTGFVLGETAVTANVTGTPTLATTATTASPVGSYPITVTSANTLSAANYDFPANLFGQAP